MRGRGREAGTGGGDGMWGRGRDVGTGTGCGDGRRGRDVGTGTGCGGCYRIYLILIWRDDLVSLPSHALGIAAASFASGNWEREREF